MVPNNITMGGCHGSANTQASVAFAAITKNGANVVDAVDESVYVW